MRVYSERTSRSTTGGAGTPAADEPMGAVHTFARLWQALADGDIRAATRYRRILHHRHGVVVIPPARWGKGGGH